jgi:hypothetical protein
MGRNAVDLELLRITHLWYVNDVTLDNFEEGMLHTFSGNVTTDTNIATRLSDLVGFIQVHNTALAPLYILSTFQIELNPS